MCSNFKKGERLTRNSYADNEDFFQRAFEVGRRYKIMNPIKMRDSYGKLMYMLQDSLAREIQKHINFAAVRPILSVSSFLQTMRGPESPGAAIGPELGPLHPLLLDTDLAAATVDLTHAVHKDPSCRFLR